MRREWSGIDKYRLDKYYSLMRKVLHESFGYLRDASWGAEYVRAAAETVGMHFSEARGEQASGDRRYTTETYMTELYKAVGAGIKTEHFEELFYSPCSEDMLRQLTWIRDLMSSRPQRA